MKTISTALLLIIAGFSIATGFKTTAQNITPTPAPSKTPTSEETTADNGNNSTQLIEPLTQDDLYVLTGNVQRPNGLVWFEDKLYTVCNGDWTVYEVDATNGSTRTYIFGVKNAHTLYAENDTNGELSLWVPDFQTNTVTRLTRAGLRTIASNLNGPWGISYLNENEFAVSNLFDNNVVIIDREGNVQQAITDLRSPTGITANDEYLYVANTGSARRAIEWFKIEDITKEEPINATISGKPLVTGLQNTTGVVLGSDGYLYFAYSLGTRGVVGRINPTTCQETECTNDQVEIVIYTELSAPLAGLSLSPDMRIFIHTMFSPDIYWTQLEENNLKTATTT